MYQEILFYLRRLLPLRDFPPPSVNFTNILQAAFAPISYLPKTQAKTACT